MRTSQTVNKMESVKVVVRCRPRNKKEADENRQGIVSMNQTIGQVVLSNGSSEGADSSAKTFTFDAVYDEHSSQKELYDETAFPLVETIFEGFNATIFAYGQTGCGKTWTMIGREDTVAERKDLCPETFHRFRGIIPNSFKHVFDSIRLKMCENTSERKLKVLVRVSFLEIYNEEVRDLLVEPDASAQKSFKGLEVKEGDQGVYVKGLTSTVVENEADLESLLALGTRHRSVGETKMNAQSSRSHSIFTIIVEISETTGSGDSEQVHYRVGKLNLVDLAGSERQSKTGAAGSRLREGCKINLSLSALSNVISALVDQGGRASKKQRFIPYRDSKLTRLLQDSLGGNTKTVMISNISPADYNYEETLSTLRYADRAKRIQNKPVVNEDPKDALLRDYQRQVLELEKLLEQKTLEEGAPLPADGVSSEASGTLAANSAEMERMEKALNEKEEELSKEQQRRGKLQRELRKMESQILHSKEQESSSEEVVTEELAAVRMAREQCATFLQKKKQVRKEEEAKLEQEKSAKETKELDEAFSTMSTGLETKQRAIKALKRRLRKQQGLHQQELSDLEREFAGEKDELVSSLRHQNRELKRLEQILDILLPETERQRLWELSEWDEDQSRWRLPPFQKPLCFRCERSATKTPEVCHFPAVQPSRLMPENPETQQIVQELRSLQLTKAGVEGHDSPVMPIRSANPGAAEGVVSIHQIKQELFSGKYNDQANETLRSVQQQKLNKRPRQLDPLDV